MLPVRRRWPEPTDVALARAIRSRGQVEPVFVDEPRDIAGVLAGLVQADDVVAMLGAGNIGQLAEELVHRGG